MKKKKNQTMNSHKASFQLSLRLQRTEAPEENKRRVLSAVNEAWTKLKKGVAGTVEEGRGYL